MTTHDYTFDVKLFATIQVRANNRAAARRIADQFLEYAQLVGNCDDRTAIETNLSLDDGEAVQLIEVDGELAD